MQASNHTDPGLKRISQQEHTLFPQELEREEAVTLWLKYCQLQSSDQNDRLVQIVHDAMYVRGYRVLRTLWHKLPSVTAVPLAPLYPVLKLKWDLEQLYPRPPGTPDEQRNLQQLDPDEYAATVEFMKDLAKEYTRQQLRRTPATKTA